KHHTSPIRLTQTTPPLAFCIDLSLREEQFPFPYCISVLPFPHLSLAFILFHTLCPSPWVCYSPRYDFRVASRPFSILFSPVCVGLGGATRRVCQVPCSPGRALIAKYSPWTRLSTAEQTVTAAE
ncbi:unnamed protein product, partial [Tuber aestivum]